MKELLISVIVPVYNVEKFLPYCMNSIINQTYQNLEIILINDGSTDNSKHICEKYATKDSRIKLINQENQGLSMARNAGLKQAKGEYISFIDSDDVISLEFYEQLLDLMLKTQADIVECGLVKVKEEGIIKDNFKVKEEHSKYIVIDKQEALNRIHNENLDICLKSVVVWNKLYKRDLFQDIQFPKGKKYEDEFTTYQVMYKANKIAIIDKIMYGYVQRASSIMGQKFSIKRLDAIEAYENYLAFIEQMSDVYLMEKFLLRYLRLLVKIAMEVEQSNYENKEDIEKILENKFRQIYQNLEKRNSTIVGIRPSNELQSKEYYYKEFYHIIKESEK